MSTTLTSDRAGTPVATPPDPDEVERFAVRMFRDGLSAMELIDCALGLRLGLYESLMAGPATPADLAAHAGIGRRYAREWLEQQAAAGILDVEDVDAGDEERRYRLSPARAHVLLERDSEAYMGALTESVVVAATWLPMLEPAYRAGSGIPYAAYGVHDRQAAFSRPQFVNQLVQSWLPALPDVRARLTAGTARLAEIGCGEGIAAVTIGRAFPGVVVHGYDLDDASIAAARRNADEAGVADRVRFEVADAASRTAAEPYDLVYCIEMLHDANDPVGVLSAMRRLRADGGAVLVVDERVADRFQLPVEPLERLLYTFSTLHCLPVGLSEEPSAGTGTVIRPPVVHRYATAAGFTSVRELPVEHPLFRLYRLDD
jgi:SAM-dependent methyltransferase